MSDIKKLLDTRKILKRKKPAFHRAGYGDRKRIDDKWRKPNGRHTKLRHQFAGHPKKVKPGFRTDSRVRGMHQSGVLPVVINSLNHVALLNKGLHGAIIGGNVGNRKRLLLVEALKKHGIHILNLKETHIKAIHEKLKQRKELTEARLAAKSKKKTKETKAEAKKEKELSQEEKEMQEKAEKDKLLTKAQK